LKGIGVTAREASPLMPELPPLAGRLPALEINNWFGLAGPAGLPREIREGLVTAFAATLADPQTARTLVERGLLPLSESGAVFEERIKRDREAWRRVVQANNIRGD
jgi:tripartite-type tricarboxylate transporter receptor subunit TctC